MLMQPASCQEFKFDFDMDAYAFISVAMLKFDKNLDSTRDKVVPDEIDDEDFWRNYFYTIEIFKAELGLPTRLGDKITQEDRTRMIEEEVAKLEDEKDPVTISQSYKS